MKQKAPPKDLEMDEDLAWLNAEAEDERRRIYMERFGALPELKHKEKRTSLDDFN